MHSPPLYRPYTPVIDGLHLEGPETTHSCGARSYKECYNQCICNHLNFMENSTHPDCLFVNYWASHARCAGKALCQQLTTITRPVPEAGVRGGLAASSSRIELDGEPARWVLECCCCLLCNF